MEDRGVVDKNDIQVAQRLISERNLAAGTA